MTETVVIAADHGGFDLKNALVPELRALGHEVVDLGTMTGDAVDYPDFAAKVTDAIRARRASRGVLICGSGIGMSIAANRHDGIRCALVSEATSAALCRAHNDANVLALGARLIGEEAALDILRVFLSTPYEGGRHDLRLAKLAVV